MSLANRRGKCTRRQELAILQFKRKVLHLGSLGNKKRDYGRSLNLDFRSTFAKFNIFYE